MSNGLTYRDTAFLAAISISAPTLDWVNRVIANGGATPSVLTQVALTRFYNGIVADGLSAKLLTINCYAPDSLIACLTPYIRGTGTDPWINNNFVSGDLTINGLAGNASTKYLDTGLNPFQTFPINFAGVSWYAFSANASGFDYGVYGNPASNPALMGASKHTDNNTYGYNGQNNLTNVVSVASSGAGYYSDNRVSSTDHKIYFASSGSAHAQIGATDAIPWANTGYPNTHMYAHAVNFSGNPRQFPSSTRISFMSINVGLTSAESAALYARVQAFRTALGGGFV